MPAAAALALRLAVGFTLGVSQGRDVGRRAPGLPCLGISCFLAPPPIPPRTDHCAACLQTAATANCTAPRRRNAGRRKACLLSGDWASARPRAASPARGAWGARGQRGAEAIAPMARAPRADAGSLCVRRNGLSASAEGRLPVWRWPKPTKTLRLRRAGGQRWLHAQGRSQSARHWQNKSSQMPLSLVSAVPSLEACLGAARRSS